MTHCVSLQLYGDYAEPFELSECKLTIIHCAGHYDPTLVDSLWAEIVDKGKGGSVLCLSEASV